MDYDTVFFGPFLGEVGWELSKWQGFCRFRSETEFKGKKILVASFPGRHVFYKDFANTFISLPPVFLDKGFDVDSYESVGISPEEYGEIITCFRKYYDVKTTREVRTPRGYVPYYSDFQRQKIVTLSPSLVAQQACDSLLEGSTEPFYFIAPRGRVRAANRNWPEECWEHLVSSLLKDFPYKIVIAGAPNGSALKDIKGNRIINTIGMPVEQSLDISVAFLERALMSITSQSGSTHLSLQTRCPSFIIGHEQKRHTVDDNYLKTPCMFLQSSNYDANPKIVFEYIKTFTEGLLEQKIGRGEKE